MTNSWETQTRTIPIRSESPLRVGDVLINLMNTEQTVTVQAGESPTLSDRRLLGGT